MAASRGKQRLASAQIWQSGAATLADEVKKLNVGWQAQIFAHVTGQARAEVTGAGAYQQSVYVAGAAIRAGEGFLSGLRGQERGIFGETRMKQVRLRVEDFVERAQGQMAGFDAVVAGQDFSQNGAGAGRERGESRGDLHRLPAFGLLVSLRRRRGAYARNKHGQG